MKCYIIRRPTGTMLDRSLCSDFVTRGGDAQAGSWTRLRVDFEAAQKILYSARKCTFASGLKHTIFGISGLLLIPTSIIKKECFAELITKLLNLDCEQQEFAVLEKLG